MVQPGFILQNLTFLIFNEVSFYSKVFCHHAQLDHPHRKVTLLECHTGFSHCDTQTV